MRSSRAMNGCARASVRLLTRLQSTSVSSAFSPTAPLVPESSSSSLSSSSARRPRIVASLLLSRPPLVLRALDKLEKDYFDYQRRIADALAAPFDAGWYKPVGASPSGKLVTELDPQELAAGRSEELMSEEERTRSQEEVRSLTRKLDRTVYLLLRKKRRDHAWQFRG